MKFQVLMQAGTMLGQGRVSVGAGAAELSEVVLATGDSSEVEDLRVAGVSAGELSLAGGGGGTTWDWVTAWLVVKTEVWVAVTGQMVVLIATT
jgi:hypothetical protein